MKIYIQTELPEDARPRQLVLETAAPADQVRSALEAIAGRLGAITAIPAPPHEHNLHQVLPRDLAALGVTAGSGAGGEAVLQIHRTPGVTGQAGQADVIGLRYEVTVTA